MTGEEKLEDYFALDIQLIMSGLLNGMAFHDLDMLYIYERIALIEVVSQKSRNIEAENKRLSERLNQRR